MRMKVLELRRMLGMAEAKEVGFSLVLRARFQVDLDALRHR